MKEKSRLWAVIITVVMICLLGAAASNALSAGDSPQAVKTNPGDGADNVPVDLAINVVFDRSVHLASAPDISVNSGAIIAAPTVDTTDKHVLWINNKDLPENSTINVTVKTGSVLDNNDVPLGADIKFSFTTRGPYGPEPGVYTNYRSKSFVIASHGLLAPNDHTYNINQGDTLITKPGSAEWPALMDLVDNKATVPDQSKLQIELVTSTPFLTLDNHSTGEFTYTPAPDYTGTETFEYRATDGTNVSEPAIITITVEPSGGGGGGGGGNGLVPQDHTYYIDKGVTELNITSPGTTKLPTLMDLVSGKDQAAHPESVTVKQDSSTDPSAPRHGQLTITDEGKGTFTYRLKASFQKDDLFYYKANDGNSDSTGSGKITIKYNPLEADPHTYPVEQGKELVVPGTNVLPTLQDLVKGKDELPNTNPDLVKIVVVSSDIPAERLIVNPTDGSFTYNPPSNSFTGTETFTYQASYDDGNLTLTSNTATITIQVNKSGDNNSPGGGGSSGGDNSSVSNPTVVLNNPRVAGPSGAGISDATPQGSTAGAQSPAAAPAEPGDLPRTGGNYQWIMALGLALIAAGIGLKRMKYHRI